MWQYFEDFMKASFTKLSTVFIPLVAQGAYQSHFRWALIITLISRFFSLKLHVVIFEEKNQGK